MAIAQRETGFLLLDSAFNPIASNPEAIRILSFPSKPERIRQLNVFLSDRIRASLVDHQFHEGVSFVREYRSGKRRYVCRTFRLDCNVGGYSPQPAIALLLERRAADSMVLDELSEQFELTQRERETVELLLQGLSSKEIANRMAISPNTVKAFLRLVMVKMGVSTRCGIIVRIAGSRAGVEGRGEPMQSSRFRPHLLRTMKRSSERAKPSQS